MSELMKSNQAAHEAAIKYETNYRYEFISTLVFLLTAAMPKPTNDSDRNILYYVGSISLYSGVYFKIKSDHYYYKAINLYNEIDVTDREVVRRNDNKDQFQISFFEYSF